MKKLIFALGAIVATTSLQASTIKWSVSGVTPQGSATTEDYVMLCFISGDTTDAAASKILSTSDAAALVNAKNFDDLNAKVAKTKILDDTGSGTSTAFNTYKSQWVNSGTSDYKGTFYAIIFNSDDITTATHYMITGEVTVKYGSAASTAQTASLTVGSWAPISPEPTSGMLMLLGMAGLALRRKRT